MIGNDIVDLQLAKSQSNWQRPKFLEKIFTAAEQDRIKSSDNPELEVWKLWTMKESAYKIYNREKGVRGFFPWKLECSIAEFSDGKFLGSVAIDDSHYYTKTVVTDSFVYTIATRSLEFFPRIIEISTTEKVLKVGGLPFTKFGVKPVSITHHGLLERRITLGDENIA